MSDSMHYTAGQGNEIYSVVVSVIEVDNVCKIYIYVCDKTALCTAKCIGYFFLIFLSSYRNDYLANYTYKFE